MESHPLDIHIGQRLRYWRQVREMTQAELGRRVGITYQQIQKYERGGSRLSVSGLHELAAALDIPLADFLPPATASERTIPRDSILLLRIYTRITGAADRKRVRQIAEIFADKKC